MDATIVAWIQLGVTVVGLLIVGYKTHIQGTRLDYQKGIIEDLKAWKDFINISTVKEWMSLKEETITLQTEKEKKEMEEKFKQSFEASESEHKRTIEKTTEEVKRKDDNLKSVEQRLIDTDKALADAHNKLLDYEAETEYYLTTSTELLNLAVMLTATHIPQEKWLKFADQHTKEVSSLFKDVLSKKGPEILNEVNKAREKLMQDNILNWLRHHNETSPLSLIYDQILKMQPAPSIKYSDFTSKNTPPPSSPSENK